MAVKPNFFIVGAPKCGTTALYEYLRPHPNIFMPELKEPHFFATDLGTYREVQTLEGYTGQFRESTEQHLRVGEASVYYLRSSAAIPNIRAFNPGAKILAMFRNPVDMVYSLHSQLLYWSLENVGDFESAWRLQARRSRGLDLPPRIPSPLLVQYGEVGQFGTQAQRLLSHFPADQVKVNKRARIAWLRDFYRRPPSLLHEGFRRLKQVAGADGIVAVKTKIVELNTAKEHRAPLSPKFRAELVETFRPEVTLLGQILDRDLSHWGK